MASCQDGLSFVLLHFIAEGPGRHTLVSVSRSNGYDAADVPLFYFDSLKLILLITQGTLAYFVSAILDYSELRLWRLSCST